MSEMKTTFIKQEQKQRVEFGFDAPIDWTPGKGACWIDCPFSVCTSFGHRCKALIDSQCPFTKNVEAFYYNDYGYGRHSLIRDFETDIVWEMILPTDDTK